MTVDLIKAIQAIAPLQSADVEAFASVFTPYSVKRKEVITAATSTERFLYFITEGVQRIYYVDEAGRDTTILFTYAPSFGGVLDSFILQQPAKYFYESLTASRMLRASFQDLAAVRSNHPAIEAMLTKGIAAALSGILERLAEVQLFTAEEKLRSLFKRSPHVFHLIPQKYLASYLGMDATNLSKFMNTIKL